MKFSNALFSESVRFIALHFRETQNVDTYKQSEYISTIINRVKTLNKSNLFRRDNICRLYSRNNFCELTGPSDIPKTRDRQAPLNFI